MGRKIFVSYKYKDSNVRALSGAIPPTMVCDYVDYLQKHVFASDDIYKGEKSDEDISWWGDGPIWEHLKNKIYDSSITIVLISPNMKEPGRWQKSQWIPWEIAYSLRNTPRKGRTSHNNAVVAVIIPDRNGSYYYYDKSTLFPILRDNIDVGYITVTTWDDFLSNPGHHMLVAECARALIPEYKLVKTL